MTRSIRTAAAIPVFAFAALLSAASPAVQADVKEPRPVSGFKAIALAAPIKLELTQGATESLVLEGDAATLAEIETLVEDGVLKIRQRSSRWGGSWGKVRATLTAKTVESLAISGSGDIRAGALRSDRLRVAISGSGDVHLAGLSASSLELAISGSGDFSAEGQVESVAAKVAGSGDIRAGKMEARRVKVSIAGSGDALFWAKDALAVRIAGSGDVRYYGDPSLVRTVVGSGSVRRLGPSPS